MADDVAPDGDIPVRGAFKFQIGANGAILNSATNVNLLRSLWLNRQLISGDDLGPGDPGDFDYGGWHSSCHLIGAGGVRRTTDGRLLWLEVSHNRACDEYFASATVRESTGFQTVSLDSAEGRMLIDKSELLGFVEGNSTGRTSARGVFDPTDRFNLWRRQDFDQPTSSTIEGGKAWEHWCTTRDLRSSCRIGASVLGAYVSLVAALGDLFPATVARGRRDYGHPMQLCALVHAGFVAEASATSEIEPHALPAAAELLFLEAEPAKALLAAEQIDWAGSPRYNMYARKLKSWSAAKSVKADLKNYKPKP